MSVALTSPEPRKTETSIFVAGASLRFGRVEVADFESGPFAKPCRAFATRFKRWVLRTPYAGKNRFPRSSVFGLNLKGGFCG